MGTCGRRVPVVCFLFWFLMGFQLCASLNHEGAALLKFKEALDADPYGALENWDEESSNPCSWFGVECSNDGLVKTLNLVNLGLKGVLHPEIGKLVHMKSLILHSNSFYGIIPTEIGDLQDLKMLDLAYNNFSGHIPSELQKILSLKFLFLKGNRLSGDLPVGSHELTRISENQDINWLNRAPTARFATIRIRRLLVIKRKDSEMIPIGGQPMIPLASPPHSPPAPSPPETIPSPSASPTLQTPTNKENKSNSSSIIYASIGAAIGLLVVVLSAVCFFYYCRKKTSTVVPLSATTSSRQLQTGDMEGITIFRRSELETACEGFSNIIGTLPGFTLYKGTLPCGAEIAVVSTTVAYAGGWSATAQSQYMNKVEALSKVNHKNLMNLVGYCEDEKPFIRMMVFEYVSNGSLYERLHVKEAEHLDWQSRLRIAMGVVYSLGYRHQQNTPVTLRNLNSSCIYLTEDDAAKVADISFGVGKKEDEDEDEDDAPDECNTVYLNGVSPVMGMVDPTLNSVPEKHVRAFSELIRLCISEDRRQRPTMAELTKRMQEITGITQDQAIPRRSALWWAELEIVTE
ncbi:unnamed protein product [Urochloa humidicola]